MYLDRVVSTIKEKTNIIFITTTADGLDSFNLFHYYTKNYVFKIDEH